MKSIKQKSKQIRLPKQFKQLQQNIQNKQLKQIQILSTNLQIGQFAITGPLDSPYQGFWFRVYFQWDNQYPYVPPKVKFLDKIWNPYINFQNGQICIDILRQSQPSLTTQKYLLSIMSLLSENKISQDIKGFLNGEAASEMRNNYNYFNEHAKRLSQIHSMKKQQIYDKSLKCKKEDHEIKAQGEQLKRMIDRQSKDPKMNIKSKNVYEHRSNSEVILQKIEDYYNLNKQRMNIKQDKTQDKQEKRYKQQMKKK